MIRFSVLFLLLASSSFTGLVMAMGPEPGMAMRVDQAVHLDGCEFGVEHAKIQVAGNEDEDSQSRYRFRFLTNDLDVVDGRPVFSSDGKYIVFMRQPVMDGELGRSALYIVPSSGCGQARVLFDGLNPKTDQPFNATRPDYSWCRCDYQIAFSAEEEGIWLLDLKTKKVKQVLESTIDGAFYRWSYPSWYPNGRALSVTNYNSYSEPLYHELVKASIGSLNRFEPLTDNQAIWPGESSVSQRDPLQLAFAGQLPVPQPPDCHCPQGCNPDGYAQDCNQIWIQDGHALEPIDQNQGRAPWFSPDGKFIVFESNRNNPDYPDFYRLHIYSLKDGSISIVTPPSLNTQHAKWSPDMRMLAFAVQLIDGAWGIATVEFPGPWGDCR